MKNIYLIIMLLLFMKITNGQEFVFPLYFEDSVGNKDTLFLGYDINATDSIDNIFGEINIITQPLHNDFDVRASNSNFNNFTTFQTKKQLIKNSCNFEYSIRPLITIEIKCKHWPVTAKWDSTLFFDTCRNVSELSSIPTGGNWDVFGPSNLYQVSLKYRNQVTFTSNYVSNFSPNVGYINNYNDTISIFWVWLDDHFPTGISNLNFAEEKYNIYIEDNYLIVKTNHGNPTIENIEIIDLTGKIIIKGKTNYINILNLSKGLYLCRIKNNINKITTYKFIK